LRGYLNFNVYGATNYLKFVLLKSIRLWLPVDELTPEEGANQRHVTTNSDGTAIHSGGHGANHADGRRTNRNGGRDRYDGHTHVHTRDRL
jgi:hypothetical protein